MRKIVLILTVLVCCAVESFSQQYITIKQPCMQCNGYGTIMTMYGLVYCPNCRGNGGFLVTVPNPNYNGGAGITFERKNNATFKKTNIKCDKCSCSGYWGYYHTNGTWEGPCQNTDKFGHTCRHSPEQHGLKSF